MDRKNEDKQEPFMFYNDLQKLTISVQRDHVVVIPELVNIAIEQNRQIKVKFYFKKLKIIKRFYYLQ